MNSVVLHEMFLISIPVTKENSNALIQRSCWICWH